MKNKEVVNVIDQVKQSVAKQIFEDIDKLIMNDNKILEFHELLQNLEELKKKWIS